MRTTTHLIISALLCALACAGCKGVPGYVVPEKKMAALLADMHTAESVVEMEHRQYATDSAKQALKQAVLAKYKVTQEQFDTSLVWYAHNIDHYIDVYDRSIALLEGRVANAGVLVSQANMSMAGDSVDVWGGSPYAVISPRYPSRMLAFDLESDENWERGDMYTYRVKLLDAEGVSVKWNITGNYADGTTEYLITSHTTTPNGWNEITFVADSTKDLTRLRGYVEPQVDASRVVWADSISLVRKRVVPERYQLRSRQRNHKSY